MTLFGFGSRKTASPAAPPPDERLVRALYQGACDYVMAPDRRIHVADLLSALAAVTGEACLRAAGELDLEQHGLAPGAPVFSGAVDSILCGDAQRWEDAPADSVFGVIYRQAVAGTYDAEAFPPLPGVFGLLPKTAGGQGAQWGWVPLSTVEGQPFIRPLQAAFDLRGPVAKAMQAFAIPLGDQPRVCAYALAKALEAVRETINEDLALSLMAETVNGMAKTAPMTAAHFAQLQQKAAEA